MLNSIFPPVSAIADTMAADPLTLYDRLMAVKPKGLSPNAWTVRAKLNRNVLNDIRKRDAAHPHTIRDLLAAIGMTEAEFEAGAVQGEKEPSSERAPFLALRGDDRPRDVPILGTAECADIDFEADGSMTPVESMQLDLDEVVDYARRPVSLDNRRDMYAIYFRGMSLSPRYEPGEIGYVDPKRPPSPGNYVVVQLRRDDGDDGERVFRVLAKRLIRMTAQYVELEQFVPPLTFRVERKTIRHIHRIVPWDELVAF